MGEKDKEVLSALKVRLIMQTTYRDSNKIDVVQNVHEYITHFVVVIRVVFKCLVHF